ncbi:serine hydrolase domain-containing protein [Formosa sp. S-31]|uniref:serine hydrolase domain-containing protein n=1 Tax=Formosa sp. S-31 TaxID=2790949 RepID=UPI003EBCB6FA
MNSLKFRIVVVTILFFNFFGCSKSEMDLSHNSCETAENINLNHPNGEVLQEKLNRIVGLGVPGVVLVLKDADGVWGSTSGLSKIETNTPMELCHLQFGQSIAKTYMATAILMLYEADKIDLDEKISNYLPASILNNIANANEATVRMLLNHTSGIAEYNDKPAYVTYLLQHPLHEFTTADYLDFVRGASPKFTPGEKQSYTNTNYELLALIADQITGDHKQFIRNEILASQGFNNTFYHNQGFMNYPELANTYWDRYSNGEIENCSEMHRINVGSLVGDDGIIATPMDYILFLEQLLTNQILSEETMKQMLDFVQTEADSPDGYGLGLSQEFINGHEQIGHTGGGIGAGCILGHYTENDTYFFLAINLGVSITPKIADPFEDIADEIYDILLE